MARLTSLFFGAALGACSLALALAGCRRSPPSPPLDRTSTAPPALANARDPSRLPEDPVLGRQSEQQWRQHMKDEEHERQLGFDRQHLAEHRAVVERLTAVRARYDRSLTESALSKTRADAPGEIADIRERVTRIDHWGVNSRLLGDYASLEELLERDYADAKLAALKGNAGPLSGVRAAFDQRMKTVTDWLEETREEENEEGHEP